jgi:2-iminobutanoate/2-iminopropanoate deaminase
MKKRMTKVRLKYLLTAVLAVVFLARGAGAQEARSYIDARNAADDNGLPFSAAVKVGDTLYLSGTIGLDEDGRVPDSAAEEARLVLDSLKSTLEKAGMSMDDLAYVQIFCSDVFHYEAFNEVYRTYFTGEFPARAFIGAGTLLFDARFEVQAIAVRRPE